MPLKGFLDLQVCCILNKHVVYQRNTSMLPFDFECLKKQDTFLSSLTYSLFQHFHLIYDSIAEPEPGFFGGAEIIMLFRLRLLLLLQKVSCNSNFNCNAAHQGLHGRLFSSPKIGRLRNTDIRHSYL